MTTLSAEWHSHVYCGRGSAVAVSSLGSALAIAMMVGGGVGRARRGPPWQLAAMLGP